MVGQLADEPDRISDAEPVPPPDVELAGERIERREQPILHENVGTRECAQDARLPGVGVAHQRGAGEVAPTLPLVRAVVGHAFEASLQDRDLAADDPAVGLELRFARAPQPDAATDPREVGPHAREARQQVLELCQLHLHFCLRRARARGEDVEDQLGAVHHPHRQRLLQIRPLHGREGLVEQHQRRAGVLEDALELLDLPLPQIEGGRGRFDALVGLAHHLGPGGIGKPAKLVQMVSHLCRLGGPLAWGANQERLLHRRLDLN